MHLSQLTLELTLVVRDDIALSVSSEFSFTPFHILVVRDVHDAFRHRVLVTSPLLMEKNKHALVLPSYGDF